MTSQLCDKCKFFNKYNFDVDTLNFSTNLKSNTNRNLQL